ncbi:SF1B family DNA helicase RecD2 [Desulfovibrio inopinatus]|uniref:SF1B family DNA helicase RecD2 n=1 Tax=Desulfovibrio inopinatus TaxID=102109 RepID=UPI00041C12E8|nr:ATP-dependent RecD-like DNA helicase [Desulfovibrio inopinatus]
MPPDTQQPRLLSDEDSSFDELRAEVSGVTFFNPETNYLIARVKATSEPGLTTIVGTIPLVTPGEILHLRGHFIEHPKYGRQFQVESFEQKLPATINGIRRYLSSGMIKGVGETLAERMIDAFGDKVLDILENDPEKLLKVEGLGKKKLKTIQDSWQEQSEVRDLMIFLQSHDIATTHAAKILKLYGRGAVEAIKQNPYDLAYKIAGIGFRTADIMATKLGLDPHSPMRLEAAIVFCLFTLSEQGHLFYPAEELLSAVADMLQDIDVDLLEDALTSLEEKKKVFVEPLPEQTIDRGVYLSHFYRYEREIAERLHALADHGAADPKKKIHSILPGIEKKAGITLSEEQRQAVIGACEHKVFVITGGPGTGKTTITKTIVDALDQLGFSIKLAAPTGRAAKRLFEASGHKATTLHRLLQYTPGGSFAFHEDNKLKADVLVIDEVSMLDATLCVNVLRALPLTCRLLLVGDVNQLPSVGPGNVLDDLLTSEAVPSVRLTHIYRQARESMIVVNSHRINTGAFPVQSPKDPPEADFFWVEQNEPTVVQQRIVELVCDKIPHTYGLSPFSEIQVLSPMHKGEVGTLALNSLLQERLNPRGASLSRGRTIFRMRDRVLQTRNNYEKDVFNGDQGTICEVDEGEGELVVDFDGRFVTYEKTELDELTPAYCVTIHKSQGSEYPAVVIPIITQHFIMLRRNLIYTALTRAKRLAVLIGGRRALAIGLKNIGGAKRFTHLRYRLQDAFNR